MGPDGLELSKLQVELLQELQDLLSAPESVPEPHLISLDGPVIAQVLRKTLLEAEAPPRHADARGAWLKRWGSSLSAMLSELEGLLKGLDRLEAQCQEVAVQTAGLRSQCDKKLQEEERLGAFAENIQERLSVLGSANLLAEELDLGEDLFASPDEFEQALEQLEEAAAYCEKHYDSGVSKAGLQQFDHLRNRACIVIRTGTYRALEKAQAQVHEVLESQGESTAVDKQVFYAPFLAAGPRVQPLLTLLQQRQGIHHTYRAYLEELEKGFCSLRWGTVGGAVEAHFAALTEGPSERRLGHILLDAGSYLLDTALRERRLFEATFEARQPQTHFEELLDRLSQLFLRYAEPLALQATSLAALLEVAEVLRTDLMEPYRQVRVPLGPVWLAVERLRQGVQMQLLKLARHEVRSGFVHIGDPSEGEYPYVLLRARSGATSPSSSALPKPRVLGRTLDLLAGTVRVLDGKSFEDLASEATAKCAAILQGTSQAMLSRHLPLPATAASRGVRTLDGTLFLVRHLLILREQTASVESADAEVPELADELRTLKARRDRHVEVELARVCEVLIDELVAWVTLPLTLAMAKAIREVHGSGADAEQHLVAFQKELGLALPLILAHFRLYLATGEGEGTALVPNLDTVKALFTPLQQRIASSWKLALRSLGKEVLKLDIDHQLTSAFKELASKTWLQIAEEVEAAPRPRR